MATLRILRPGVPFYFKVIAVIDPFAAEAPPLTATLPVAIRFVVVRFAWRSMLSAVVCKPPAVVSDISFRR